jgi:hypothetical protein
MCQDFLKPVQYGLTVTCHISKTICTSMNIVSHPQILVQCQCEKAYRNTSKTCTGNLAAIWGGRLQHTSRYAGIRVINHVYLFALMTQKMRFVVLCRQSEGFWRVQRSDSAKIHWVPVRRTYMSLCTYTIHVWHIHMNIHTYAYTHTYIRTVHMYAHSITWLTQRHRQGCVGCMYSTELIASMRQSNTSSPEIQLHPSYILQCIYRGRLWYRKEPPKQSKRFKNWRLTWKLSLQMMWDSFYRAANRHTVTVTVTVRRFLSSR